MWLCVIVCDCTRVGTLCHLSLVVGPLSQAEVVLVVVVWPVAGVVTVFQVARQPRGPQDRDCRVSTCPSLAREAAVDVLRFLLCLLVVVAVACSAGSSPRNDETATGGRGCCGAAILSCSGAW